MHATDLILKHHAHYHHPTDLMIKHSTSQNNLQTFFITPCRLTRCRPYFPTPCRLNVLNMLQTFFLKHPADAHPADLFSNTMQTYTLQTLFSNALQT